MKHGGCDANMRHVRRGFYGKRGCAERERRRRNSFPLRWGNYSYAEEFFSIRRRSSGFRPWREGAFFWGGEGGVGPMGRQRVWRWASFVLEVAHEVALRRQDVAQVRAEAFLRRRRRASSCRLSEGTCGSVPVMAKSARSVFVFCGKTPAWAFDVEGRKGSVVLWGAFRRVWGALLMRQRGTCRGRA